MWVATPATVRALRNNLESEPTALQISQFFIANSVDTAATESEELVRWDWQTIRTFRLQRDKATGLKRKPSKRDRDLYERMSK